MKGGETIDNMLNPIKLIKRSWRAGMTIFVVMTMLFGGMMLTLNPTLATGDNDKVTICHASGQAGTTKFETLTLSKNAVYGEAGHFNENGTPRAGHEEDYLGSCKGATPSPTPSVKPTPTPGDGNDCDRDGGSNPSDDECATPSPKPSPTVPNVPNFPACLSFTGSGDNAHYDSGLHQIVGNGLLEGKDDVYSIGNGNYVQCFVPPAKDVCIQTDWWRTDAVLDGWYSVNGSQWNLGNFHFLARNRNYNCTPSPTPTPSPSPTPVVSPTPTTSTTNENNNNNDNHQEQTQNNNQTVNITVGGSVAGVTTPKTSPETGVSVLGLTSMFGAGPVGFFLSKFGKGNVVKGKKEENLGEEALRLVKEKGKRLSA